MCFKSVDLARSICLSTQFLKHTCVITNEDRLSNASCKISIDVWLCMHTSRRSNVITITNVPCYARGTARLRRLPSPRSLQINIKAQCSHQKARFWELFFTSRWIVIKLNLNLIHTLLAQPRDYKGRLCWGFHDGASSWSSSLKLLSIKFMCSETLFQSVSQHTRSMGPRAAADFMMFWKPVFAHTSRALRKHHVCQHT